MTINNIEQLQQEWHYQQGQFDSYEKASLLIKLSHLVVAAGLIASDVSPACILVFNLIFWGSDAIWKTFQFRIEERLMALEQAIKASNMEFMPYQFNLQFNANRPSTIGLIVSYAKNALRPTVAFPHAVLFAYFGLHALCAHF